MRFPVFAATAPDAELREYRPVLIVQVAIAAALVGLLGGFVIRMFFSFGPHAEYEYQLWKWEADTFAGTLFRVVGMDGQDEGLDEREALRQYYGYTSQIRGELNQAEPDTGLVSTLTSERAVYAKDVERIVADYIEGAIAEAGLKEDLPFFSTVEVTWPPVNFKVTSPPQLLVTSPRDEIRRKSDTLLRTGLTAEEIVTIEEEADGEDEVSLVVAIGGLAAYPAFVRDDRNYYSTVETASHEWVHHYLAFYPLGQAWGSSGAANTLNETTASLAGRELAALVHGAHPIEFESGEDGGIPNATERTVDFNAEMRKLRLEVDALLADGEVEEAEALMEETRLYLADHGVVIRKLNQAYFAFYGTYADSPASSDPIGPKVERVWELTGDVGSFLMTMREVASAGDLDEALVKLERLAGVTQAN